jgi:hypothetical protein
MIHGSGRYYASGRKKKYNAWSTKKRPEPKFEEYVPPTTYRRGDTSHIPSRIDPTPAICGKPEPKVYTGTLVKGISTMHKSNAVPIIDEQEAKDHANMRR